jgi:hypothetical protein
VHAPNEVTRCSYNFFRQYQESSKSCQLGPAVRLGFEGANTDNWCEPHPPTTWNGRRLKSRKNGECEWGEALPNQCFGLGPEVTTPSGKRRTAESCAATCCETPTCEMWQELPDRGCFMANSKGIWCDTKQGAYDGQRKCVKDFCGGMEDIILPAFLKRHSNITN